MAKTEPAELAQLDKAHVWHPFTQMKMWQESDPLIIESAEGCELIDTQGRRYLDGVSSLWVNVHGHRVPEIDQAIRDQLDLVAHSTLLGLSNIPSIELARKLVEHAQALSEDGAGAPLTKVFYSEAGACGVEIALKMAFSFWQQRHPAPKGGGTSNKRTFVSLEHSYHGDTLGAVAVGGIDLFHAAYRPLLFETLRVPSPYCYRCPLGKSLSSCSLACLQPLEDLLERRHEEICAVIIEPLVQAAGGMITAPPGYLRRVREVCDQFGVLLLADEVATGVGRTGTFFACEQEGVSPDILIAGKGLTGGYLPLAVTLTTEEIYTAFLGDIEESKTFYHGHTYTGNPLACAAALANIELMGKMATLEHVRALEPIFRSSLEPLAAHPHVGEIRRRGLMCGIELVEDRAGRVRFNVRDMVGQRVVRRARENGVIIRPLGDVVVLMPPLAISADDLKRLVSVTAEAVDFVTGAR